MANHNVSLNGLRVFEAAARHLNFTSAALELNVSQAAVSQQIRNLENQLESKLFERGARELSLTMAGRDLSVATSSALHTINNSLDSITGENDSRVLTISTCEKAQQRFSKQTSVQDGHLLSSWQAGPVPSNTAQFDSNHPLNRVKCRNFKHGEVTRRIV